MTAYEASLDECDFYDNAAGALHAIGNLFISYGTFRNNTAVYGGAVYATNVTSALFFSGTEVCILLFIFFFFHQVIFLLRLFQIQPPMGELSTLRTAQAR